MKRYLNTSASIAILATFLATGANASDLFGGSTKDTPSEVVSYKAPSFWNGLYLGAHGGYGWGGWDGSFGYDDASKYPNITFDDGSREINGDNWFGGLQLGANRQFGSVVVGIEADASYAGFEGSTTFDPYPLPQDKNEVLWNTETSIEYFGTVRGRLGLLVKPNLLVYGTGGLAWALADSSITATHPDGKGGRMVSGYGTNETAHIGWTAGGGFEWALNQNVSFKTEYLYVDLGEEDYNFVGAKSYDTDHYNPEVDFHTVRAGLNWKF